MAERRPFPPSPRRRELARQAGLTATSPLVVGAAALGAGALALVLVGSRAAQRIGDQIAAACAGHATLAPAGAPAAVLDLAAPALGAIALAAIAGHVVQTRAVWLPRRRIADAPALERSLAGRALPLVGAAAIAGVTVGWLWWAAPRIARLVEVSTPLPAAAALLASLVAALAVTWLVTGVADALVRHAELGGSLAMTPADKRADDRRAAADPRWRARRAQIAREPAASPAIAGAALVVLGDDVAVAIAWDAARQPVPLRVHLGRGAGATQALGLARRHRIAVHRDAALAAALARAAGPVPEQHWSRLAEIIAATRASM